MAALATSTTPAAVSMSESPSRRPSASSAPGRGGGAGREGAAVDARGVEVAEDQVGVGHCRLGPTEPVARRARYCARAPRADAERARAVRVGDGAAAGADGLPGPPMLLDV